MSRNIGAVLIILFVPILLMAQSTLPAGAKYVNFEVDRTPLISAGYFLQNGLALEAGGGVAFNGEMKSNGLALRVGLDKYLKQKQSSPFIGGYARFDINPNALYAAGWKGSRLTLGGQLGLNVFIIKQLAVAGAVGGEIQLNSPRNRDSSVNLVSFTSGIKLRYFF